MYINNNRYTDKYKYCTNQQGKVTLLEIKVAHVMKFFWLPGCRYKSDARRRTPHVIDNLHLQTQTASNTSSTKKLLAVHCGAAAACMGHAEILNSVHYKDIKRKK